jgi:hypothetical protein
MNGSTDSLSCFHSSASASQYSISENSISFLASAARSRHMRSIAANCFFEYMSFTYGVRNLAYSPPYQRQLTMPLRELTHA